MKVKLGDAAACYLFVHTKFPDGCDGADVREFDEKLHVGFNLERVGNSEELGTYFGKRKVRGYGDKQWWIVAVKAKDFKGYAEAELYDSFEDLKSEWTLE